MEEHKEDEEAHGPILRLQRLGYMASRVTVGGRSIRKTSKILIHLKLKAACAVEPPQGNRTYGLIPRTYGAG